MIINDFKKLPKLLSTNPTSTSNSVSQNTQISSNNKYHWKIKDHISGTEQILQIEELSDAHITSIYKYIKRNLNEGHIMGHKREDWLRRLRYEPKRRKIDEFKTFNVLSGIFRNGTLGGIFRTIKYDIKSELNQRNYERPTL